MININLNAASDLNHLMTVTQHFEFIVKLFLKSLTSSVILIEINDMKTLTKTMKIMILVMIVIVSQSCF